ncbi:hypothetical protein TYRP_015966 [Tyrophagus putrescentiae]|nr:hypothetical protein TYRP_015966 [Tyrophagus putrescentiae]
MMQVRTKVAIALKRPIKISSEYCVVSHCFQLQWYSRPEKDLIADEKRAASACSPTMTIN